MKTKRIAFQCLAAFALAAASVAVAPASMNCALAQSGIRSSVDHRAAQAYAQAGRKSRRARTRIRVTPVYPYRTESLPYPPPYEYEYPGPNAVRQCSARLVQEARPSGTVIVPRMNCWWERY
jgi:hypothetical protein